MKWKWRSKTTRRSTHRIARKTEVRKTYLHKTREIQSQQNRCKFVLCTIIAFVGDIWALFFVYSFHTYICVYIHTFTCKIFIMTQWHLLSMRRQNSGFGYTDTKVKAITLSTHLTHSNAIVKQFQNVFSTPKNVYELCY